MSMTPDQIVDRRRLRRKLTFWRVVAFLVVLVVIGGSIIGLSGRDTFPLIAQPQIARVSVTGFITVDQQQIALLRKLAETDAVKGVIVAIDSTGGATTGGEALYEALRKLAEAKPTVATMGTFGASAAYMAAIATDHVVARRTSLTGSIGVLFQLPQISALMEKIGVEVEEIKSGPLKAEPTPFKPASEEAKAAISSLVRDSFDWFVDIVAERRRMDRAQALGLADGRIFTGGQALAVDLVDEIGGEDAALAWLGTRGVDTNLPIRDWRPADSGRPLWSFADAAAVWIVRTIGLSPDLVRGGALDQILPENLRLDGLQSVWQGSPSADQRRVRGAVQ